MTELPDDMEKRLASMANWFSQLTDAPAPVSSSQAAKDLRALLLAYQERGRALEAASPVVPAPEGEAWRTVPVEPTEAMLVNGREALMPLVRLDSYGPLIGVWGDMLAASPVVPVGASRETVHDLILMRVFGPCDAISDELDSAVWNAADAIIAALRPTDAGWRDIAGAPLGVRGDASRSAALTVTDGAEKVSAANLSHGCLRPSLPPLPIQEPTMTDLIKRLESVLSEHNRLASWNRSKDRPARVAFHHDAALAVRDAIAILKATDTGRE